MSTLLLLVIRAAGNLLRWRVPLLPKLCVAFNFRLFNCCVGAGAKIGKGVVLEYAGLGIGIHEQAVIGDEVEIGPHAVIGGRPKVHGAPRIGDRCVIEAGAIVLGPIRIGEGARILPNALVLTDVEAGAVVGGVPARRLRQPASLDTTVRAEASPRIQHSSEARP